MLTVLDLFSGIGGFSLGLERTGGFKTIAFCENDEYCQKILAKHWPEIPCHQDVRTLDGKTIHCDVVTAGFPCQPYSRAGFRKGKKDSRDMVGPMLSVLEGTGATWFIGENTEGFVDLGLDALCDDLEALGYTVQSLDIRACAAGLPTMERHIWIVAAASSQRLQRFWEITAQIIENGTEEFQRSDSRDFRRWHLPTSRVCGVGERFPHRLERLKSLGNAVPPQIPEIIGHAILASHKEV